MPAALAGFLGQDLVERRLGRPGPTAALLAGAGVVLWAADRRPESGAIGTREVVAVSAAQVLALAPGVSRSGATLTALRALRVPRREAVRFSLLVSLPLTAGAAGLTVLRSGRRPPVLPVALAGVTAVASATALDRRAYRFAGGTALYRLACAAAVAVRLRRENP